MSSLPRGLYALLLADAPLNALIAGRISPVELPQGSQLPALTYRRIGGASDHTLEGLGPQRVRLEFNCYGASSLDADDVRTALRELLDGYRGTLSDGTVLDDVQIVDGGRDFYDQDPRQFRCLVEFYLSFTF